MSGCDKLRLLANTCDKELIGIKRGASQNEVAVTL